MINDIKYLGADYMADQHIVITDTTNRVLPLAWGVAGGNIVSNSVNITNSTGTTTANVVINNAVVTMNDSTITVNNTNTSFNNTGITINSTNNAANVAFSDTTISSSNSTTLAANEVISVTANDVNISSPNNITLSSPNINTTGMLFSISAGSVSFSAGNFTVTGPANFTAPTTFNSVVGFSSICTFNNTVYQSNFISNLPYTEISTNGIKTSQSNIASQVSNNITTVGTIVDSNTAFVGQSKFRGVINSNKLAFNTLNFIDKSNVIYTQTVGTTVSITTSQTIPTKIVEMTITDALTVDSNTILELACATISENIGSVFVQLSTNTKNYNLHYVGTSINNNIRFAELLDTDSPDIQLNSSSISFNPNELKVSVYVTPSVTLSVPTTNFTLTVYQTKDVSTISGGGVDLTNILTPYSNTNTYVVNDLVYYNGYLYKCNTAITTPEDFDSSKWTQTTLTTELSTVLKFISSLQNLNNIQF